MRKHWPSVTLDSRLPLVTVVLSVGFFFFCDGVIFRSGFYQRYMANNDVGKLAWRSDKEKKRPALSQKTVALLGNSQLERGFSASLFAKDFSNAGVKVIRLDAPKTYEEIWYYELQKVDPDHNKYSAIAITVPDFTVEPFVNFGEAPSYSNATFLAQLLTPTQWPEVISEYKDPQVRLKVAELAVFASHRYAFDLQDLALNLDNRNKENLYKWTSGDEWDQDPPEVWGSWEDIKINGEKFTCPPLYDHFDCLNAQSSFEPLSAADAALRTATNTEYEKKWLGKIFQLYQGSPTRIIVVQMPRWAVPLPQRTPIAGAPDLRSLEPAQSNVTFIDPQLLESLETPTYMHDHVHVSTAAVPVFTRILGAKLIQATDPSIDPSQLAKAQ